MNLWSKPRAQINRAQSAVGHALAGGGRKDHTCTDCGATGVPTFDPTSLSLNCPNCGNEHLWWKHDSPAARPVW